MSQLGNNTAQIVSFHSFRRGTGKSHLAANLAVLAASSGHRVGVIDINFQSPSSHILFGLEEREFPYTLNDYLQGTCSIDSTIIELTHKLGLASMQGQLFLVTTNPHLGEIAHLLRNGYEISRLNQGFQEFIAARQLDMLIIDTHAGLNEETMLSIAISDMLVMIVRPDRQDHQGTGVTIEVARRLNVPRILLIVNEVVSTFDLGNVKAQMEQAYHCEVAAVLPHTEEITELGSKALFVVRYPDHPLTATLKKVATLITVP